MAFLIKNPESLFVLFSSPEACCHHGNAVAAIATATTLYNTSLPTMTPTTKKRTMSATVRALSPSSFTMPTEEEAECWDDITLLFLIRRPSSS